MSEKGKTGEAQGANVRVDGDEDWIVSIVGQSLNDASPAQGSADPAQHPEEEGQQRRATSKEPGPRGRNDPLYDHEFLWRVYVQCSGDTGRMLELQDPGVPKSRRTLQAYIKKHGFRERLDQELAKVKPPEVTHIATAQEERFNRLRAMETALYELLTPKVDPVTGEKSWPVAPKSLEGLIDKFLKLVDRLELMSGGVTSRSEVRAVVEVNVKVVCATFGQVINGFVTRGDLSPKIARQIVDQFSTEIRSREIVLEALDKPSKPAAS